MASQDGIHSNGKAAETVDPLHHMAAGAHTPHITTVNPTAL